MMHAAPEDPQQARVGWSGGNPLAGIVSSAAARVQQAATPNKQQLFEQVKQPADVMTTKPFFQMPANKEQLSEQVKQSNVMATKPVVQTPKFGMLAVPSASSKPLPSLGDEHMSPADYAAYFTKDESRIRELITRIAKINEAYLRHSTRALDAASEIDLDAEDGPYVPEDGAEAIHELFVAAEEHSVLLTPLLFWVGYPERMANEENRTTCTRLAIAAMAHKESMMRSSAAKPLLHYARSVYGVVSF